MPTDFALQAMLPEHLLLLGMVALIVAALVRGGQRIAPWLGAASVVGAVASALWLAASGVSGEPFVGQLVVSPSIYMAKALLLALAIPVLLMGRDEFDTLEFPLLLVASLYGLSLLPSAQNALVMFLGLEMMSIPVYALVVLAFRRPQAAESALKYLVLSGTATAMFLMGMSLLYGSTGAMSVSAFSAAVADGDGMARMAVLLTLLSLFLKGAVVPFHGWAPDTYEGASIPVTAYMATLSKAAVLIVTMRLFEGAMIGPELAGLVAVLPLLSIVWGNLAAMRQTGLRRMIAYSSIAHAGYLFYALLGDPAGRTDAIMFYVIVYAASNLLAFAAVPPGADDATRDRLATLEGLFYRNPFAATAIAVAMLSLSGLPPFPGFTAKFLIFRTVVDAGYTTWAVLGLVGSFLGLYFYLRVIMRMFMTASPAGAAPSMTTAAGRLASVLCLMATLALTIAPGWLLAQF